MTPRGHRLGRKSLPHHPPFWVRAGAIYFVTVCSLPRGKNQFCEPACAAQLFETVRFRHAQQVWHCLIFLLMPDHVHALLSLPEPGDLKKVFTDWKAWTSKLCGICWQRDFFDHRLRSGEQWEMKARYIEENPVRKGLVTHPEEWPYVWKPNL